MRNRRENKLIYFFDIVYIDDFMNSPKEEARKAQEECSGVGNNYYKFRPNARYYDLRNPVALIGNPQYRRIETS